MIISAERDGPSPTTPRGGRRRRIGSRYGWGTRTCCRRFAPSRKRPERRIALATGARARELRSRKRVDPFSPVKNETAGNYYTRAEENRARTAANGLPGLQPKQFDRGLRR